jgi:hypothetical protein
MLSYVLLLLAVGLITKSSAASELSVNVYEGPKDCDDSEKVKAGDYVS